MRVTGSKVNETPALQPEQAARPSTTTSRSITVPTPSQLQPAQEMDHPDDPLRRLRKCEAVIQRRSSRIVIVVERCTQSHNYSAVLRTAEALGIQHVWLVCPPSLDHDADARAKLKKSRQWEDDAAELREHVAYAKKASRWLTLRFFQTAEDCVSALREDGREIWVSDLSQDAVCLTTQKHTLPDKVALVMGTESTGASPIMLQAADLRVYLPLHGWADSLNLSVATALMTQRLLDIDESAIGDMSPEEKHTLRAKWYPEMARSTAVHKGEREKFTALVDTPVEPFQDCRRCNFHRAGYMPKKLKKKMIAKGQLDGIGF